MGLLVRPVIRLALLFGAGSFLTIYLLAITAQHPDGALINRDFSNLWVAGRLAIEGRVGDIFDVAKFREASHAMLGMTSHNNYSYPPHALFLAMPFALLAHPIAFWLWNALSAAFFVWAARPHLPSGFPPILAAFTPAALACYWFGHYGLLIGGLWFLAFSGSGTAAALMTIKPHLGLLVAVQMLRNRRELAVCLAWVAALIGASAAVFGVASWIAFLTVTFSYQVGLLRPHAMPVMNLTSVSPVIGYGIAGWVAFASAALAILYRNFNLWTAATATFLIVPYGFHYDLTVVCLGLGVLIYSRWHEMQLWERALVSLAFLVPELLIFGAWIAPPLLLAALFVQSRHPLEKMQPARS